MKGMHARLPKSFVLEEQLELYANAIELAPCTFQGYWKDACWPLGELGAYKELRIDLGCGKGVFLAEAAILEPDVLFIGIDAEPMCVAYAARAISEAHASNALVVPAMGDALPRIFAQEEINRIYINFPTPFPRKKETRFRLTTFARLMEYRSLLAPDGVLSIKSDSAPFMAWTRVQLANAGFELMWESNDARAAHPHEPYSGYERRLASQGACVYALEAVVGKLPTEQLSVSDSLADFLPDDLDNIGYVPLGMRATVENLRNRARVTKHQ